MYIATIIPFDGDDSPVTKKQFNTLKEAKEFAYRQTKNDWSTVRVRATNNTDYWPDFETSHACGKNDAQENGEYLGTF